MEEAVKPNSWTLLGHGFKQVSLNLRNPVAMALRLR